tara:strand:+ start:1094 stop:1816 length:723 start_codon:yes stop_codon:yes gene_type:complete
MGNNPVKKEYTKKNKEKLFNFKEANFLLDIDRNNVGFTGNYEKITDDEFLLETIVYENFDLSKYDSKTFLDNNPDKIIKLIAILAREFWIKGWIQGNLDSSNIIVFHIDNKLFFKIFNFDKIEHKSPENSFYFFKFIWSDIRKFMKEYLELELVRNTKTKKCYWLYKKEYFFNTDNKLEDRLCNIIDMSPNSNINVGKNIKDTLQFLDKFSVYKYLYPFMSKDNTKFRVVYDKMILSKDD